MFDALIWLLTIELVGLTALPFTFGLFRRLPDRGLIFSKLLGLLVVSYTLWILGVAHILPNSQYTIIGILAVMALVSYGALRHRLPEIVAFVRGHWVPLLTAQLVFLGLYALWLSVVFNAPAINHTEKPMDFAFLNAVLQSRYFPPEDPWLAGHSISYYYFGHFMMATLTKLTAISSSVTYNLSVAVIPALVGAAAFSLVYNMVRLSGARMVAAVGFGLAAPLLVALIGNLEGVLEFVNARGWGSDGFWEWVSIKGLGGGQGADPSVFPTGHWWWWRATRVIDTVQGGVSLDYTITEFPFFSFLLGDLHPHVLSLPFLIMTLAVGLNLFVSRDKLGFGWLRRNPWEAAAITLLLGSLAFLNIWDFPVFAVVIAALVLVKCYGDWGGQFQRAWIPALTVLVPVLLGAVLVYLPFYLNLGSQASGISAIGEVSTRPFFFFLIWGLLLVLGVSFLIRQLWTVPNLTGQNPGILATVIIITFLPFLLWAGWRMVISPLGDGFSDTLLTVGARFGKLLPGLVIVGVALYSMILRFRYGSDRVLAFVLLPLSLAFYLLMGAELFRVVDLFGNRMNTVFKLYYQAWLFLAIASAYGLYYWFSCPMPSVGKLRIPLQLRLGILTRVMRYGWVGLVAVLFLASIYIPVGAALDRRGEGSTFDGLAFLKNRNTDEYEAIRWLRDEATWGRIVEAVGRDYSEYARISSSTGLPTVLGWKGHERQWRGSTRPFRGREEQVEQIYRSNDPDVVRGILDHHDIRYVYLGRRERSSYGDSHLDKFPFLRPVFPGKDVVINDVVIYEKISDSGRGLVERDHGDAG